MNATSHLHTTTPLAAGECLHLPVDAGTVLVAMRGALRIEEAPRWLAECWVPVRRRLDEGQSYRVEQAGWLRVHALGDAQLGHVLARPRLARLLDWLLRRHGTSRPAVC